jgi:predicted ATPase/class 3 adenylate cyclase
VSAAAAPSGVVTFLFTDVEGSTRRWEADAEAMRNALAAHDEALRSAIEAHGGWLFKHTGDGVCAAFASPRSAVDAAVAAQRAVELPVRMGLATGEAELRDGDYFGTALNRAARVMAAGHGGQILAADSTAGLVTGVDLIDLGPRRLRGVPTPVGLFQVRAPGIRAEFPPLRALDTTPGNLRRATSILIGRESEAAELHAVVKAQRLVTLTGVGGVGKTCLATEVAARMADEFPDGLWFFDLAAITNPAAVPDAVAAVLGITQQPGKTVGESVAAALEGRIRLLVFDNCEHVRDAAADLIEAILAASATVTIVATSREGLGIADEQMWPVPSLDVDAAVDLFVERAHRVAPAASAHDAGAVAEICRRLDGIPLAIELAASRMAAMTASEVRDRLDQRFRLLVGSQRGLARHQTLRHAVAWSYDHLEATEKSVLQRCSVFAGGFDLQSACAVAGFDSADDLAILDLLDALVRKSLLTADRSSERTRFSMLDTIRQFAAEQLVADGEATEARTAHARHFAGREADIMALWDSPRQREAYDWFAIELANLRAAFRWAADSGDLDAAAAIATYSAFLGWWFDQFEPIAWAEELIQPASAAGHHRLAYLYLMASQCYLAGRIESAVRYADEGQKVVDAGHDDLPFGIEGPLGGSYLYIGQAGLQVAWCTARLLRGRDARTITRACLVLALKLAGCPEESVVAARGLVEAAAATRNPCAYAFALGAFGFAHFDADTERALEAVRKAVLIAQASGNRNNETHLAGTLCRLEAKHGDPLASLDYLTLAIGNMHDSGNTTTIRSPLAVLSSLCDRFGRHESAATIAGFAFVPLTVAAVPEFNAAITHLREVLGGPTYESLVREGQTMTTAEMVGYAHDQIDWLRSQLTAVSN